MEPIYCKKKFNTLSKKKFLAEYLNDCAPETYWVADDTIQCSKRRRRSIGDLNALLDGTFKTKTHSNKLIKILVELVGLRDDESLIKCLYCGNVKKIVFFSANLYSNNWTFRINNKHFYEEKIVGVDGYSWKNLIEIYDK